MSARQRFFTDPPTFYGVYELRDEYESEAIRWEIWHRYPAFRMETTFQEAPLVLATLDGERFTYREGSDVGTTRGLGEQAVNMIAPPLLQVLLRDAVSSCDEENVIGVEEIVGRYAIHSGCADNAELWTDSATGLILATFEPEAGPGGDTTTGFTSIEFDPEFDESLFNARLG